MLQRESTMAMLALKEVTGKKKHVSQSSLRADRWWADPSQGQGYDPDEGRCLGIRCNI